jgi:talin
MILSNNIIIYKISKLTNLAFKSVTAGVTKLLETAKKGAIGELMCDEALDAIVQAIASLDTASLFAAAGQLEIDSAYANVNPLELQKELPTLAKELAANSSKLVAASKTTPENFGTTAKHLGVSVTKLASSAKNSGALMPDMNSQQSMLSAVKAVAITAQQLVLAGKDALRFKQDATAHKTLLKGADSVAESISSLISLAQATESESAKGMQILTSAKADFQRLLNSFDNTSGRSEATPVDIVKAARAVAGATALFASANGNQDTIAKASKSASDSCRDLIDVSKGASKAADDPAVASATTDAAKNVVKSIAALIDAVKDVNFTGLGAQSILDIIHYKRLQNYPFLQLPPP